MGADSCMYLAIAGRLWAKAALPGPRHSRTGQLSIMGGSTQPGVGQRLVELRLLPGSNSLPFEPAACNGCWLGSVCVSFVGELSGAQDVLPISPAVGHKRLWPKAIFHRSLG